MKAVTRILAAGLLVFAAAAAAQDWGTQAQQVQQAQALPQAPTMTWQAFRCTAPASNYQRRRVESEMQACIQAHNYAFWGVYQTFLAARQPQSGNLTLYVTVEPTGVVSNVTAASKGAIDKKLIAVITVLMHKIEFGSCNICKSETYAYPMAIGGR